MRLSVSSVIRCIIADVALSDPENSLIASMTAPIVPSNSRIASSTCWRCAPSSFSLARSASVDVVAMSKRITRVSTCERRATAAPEKR